MHTYYITYVLTTSLGKQIQHDRISIVRITLVITPILKKTEIRYFLSQRNVHQIVENIDVRVF